MCLEDLRIGRHKTTLFPGSATQPTGQHPGTQTTLSGQLASPAGTGILLAANPLRTAIRLVLVPFTVPGSGEHPDPVIDDCVVYGFIADGPPNTTPNTTGPLYAALAVGYASKLTDQIRIEDIGNIITQPWGFQSINTNNAATFGGFTVWDIMGDRVLMYNVQRNDMKAA